MTPSEIRVGMVLTPTALQNFRFPLNKLPKECPVLGVRRDVSSYSGKNVRVRTLAGDERWVDAGWFYEVYP